jgi:hypothetical protein
MTPQPHGWTEIATDLYTHTIPYVGTVICHDDGERDPWFHFQPFNHAVQHQFPPTVRGIPVDWSKLTGTPAIGAAQGYNGYLNAEHEAREKREAEAARLRSTPMPGAYL